MCLVWPALWNRYPIVFSDTGTYLSQAVHRYFGWDRPVFYSLFILPLHLALTTWPVVVAQSWLAVLVLDQVRRAFGLTIEWLLGLTVVLAVVTWLPWTVSELMPDLFTPLLVLLLGRLVFQGSLLGLPDRMAIIVLAAFMIATQQSSVPLALGLLTVVIPLRRIRGRGLAGSRCSASILVCRPCTFAGARAGDRRFGPGERGGFWTNFRFAVRQRVRPGAGYL